VLASVVQGDADICNTSLIVATKIGAIFGWVMLKILQVVPADY